MAQNESTGNLSVVKVDTHDGETFNVITNQLDATLSITSDAPESTNKSSSQEKSFLIGNVGWSVSGSGQIDSEAGGNTDGLVLMRTAQLAKQFIDIQVLENGTADTMTGDGIVTELSMNYPQNAAQNYSYTVQGTGTLAVA